MCDVGEVMILAEIRKYSVITCLLLMSYSLFAMEVTEKTKAALTYEDIVSMREKHSLSAERMQESHKLKKDFMALFNSMQLFPQALDAIIFAYYYDDNKPFKNGVLIPISWPFPDDDFNSRRSCYAFEDRTCFTFHVYDIDSKTNFLMLSRYGIKSAQDTSGECSTDVTQTPIAQTLLKCLGQEQAAIRVERDSMLDGNDDNDLLRHFLCYEVHGLSVSFANTQVEPVSLSSEVACNGQIDSGVFLAPGLNGKDFARSLMLSIAYIESKKMIWAERLKWVSEYKQLFAHYDKVLAKQLRGIIEHDDPHVVPFLYSSKRTFSDCHKNSFKETACHYMHVWFEENVVGWKKQGFWPAS